MSFSRYQIGCRDDLIIPPFSDLKFASHSLFHFSKLNSPTGVREGFENVETAKTVFMSEYYTTKRACSNNIHEAESWLCS